MKVAGETLGRQDNVDASAWPLPEHTLERIQPRGPVLGTKTRDKCVDVIDREEDRFTGGMCIEHPH